MGLFLDRTKINNKTQVPVWFMRQAGRYHSHYQNIKKNSDFMKMCKDPQLAFDVTMGPIDDFNFDAAILFSDLLFPLEHLGMGLNYYKGPPALAFRLESIGDIKKCHLTSRSSEFYQFQKEALSLIRPKLAKEKSLLGFVGAPFTLYTYAVEGVHAGALTSSKLGFYDGRYEQFINLLYPALLDEMLIQAEGGADAVCLFDTAVGELTLPDFKEFIIPTLRKLTSDFKAKFPNKKIVYYSKLTHLAYLDAIQDKNIDVLGIDWRHDMAHVLSVLGKDYYIQGNLDPSYLHYPWPILEQKLNLFWANITKSPLPLDHFIMGLGHGVLQETPEENVKNTVALIHKNFLY